ncbi:hypothetical protein [Mycobacterium europaeum]|uniref:hypothetical protein n=1 Tax=Mycobacterium europaeum TaxID=761804 RepID=UPI00114764B5|nr:hypothetical protein [Mycobacterium europaeum]
MEMAEWFIVTTAIGIPIGNAIFAGILGLVGARVGRNATRYSAELQAEVNRQDAALQAAQRRHDVEIAQLRESQEALLTAATAVQSFVWYAENRAKSGIPITTEEWQAARPLVEPAILAAEKLRVIAPTLPTETLRNAYIEVERLAFKVVAGASKYGTNPSKRKTNQTRSRAHSRQLLTQSKRRTTPIRHSLGQTGTTPTAFVAKAGPRHH